MQTLGLDPSTPRTEGRLKSLLWPSVANDADVDYLTTQGFWICFLVAAVTLAVSIVSGLYAGALDAIFFYLGGNGVRQRSRIAAVCVFLVYALGTVDLARVSYAAGGSGSIVRFLLCALLLTNMREVWIASQWRSSGVAEETPDPLSETLADTTADRVPGIVWPKTRYLFYAFALLEIGSRVFVLFVGRYRVA